MNQNNIERHIQKTQHKYIKNCQWKKDKVLCNKVEWRQGLENFLISNSEGEIDRTKNRHEIPSFL